MTEFLENIDPIWISLVPLIAVNVIMLITVLIFIPIYKRRPADHFSDKHHSKLLNRWFKEYWLWVTSPLEKLALMLHLTPNVLTFIGFLISCVSAYFFHLGWLGIGGWVMILGSTFDMLDGRVARLTGKSSEAGAFFDSIMDRFGELVILIGITSYFRNSWMLYVLLLVIVGTTMVSYTRARGQGFNIDCNQGSMQRPERAVYISVSAIFAPVLDRIFSFVPFWTPQLLFIAALVFMAVMTNITAIHRFIYIKKELEKAV